MNARLASRDQPGRSASPRRRVTVAMLGIPLVITATALLVMALAGGDLGREVVVHWGPEGPDGWAPAWMYLVLGGVVGAGLPVLMWVSMARASRVSGTAVFLAGFMIWLSAFLGISMSAALLAQPEHVQWWLLTGAIGGLALAIPAWTTLRSEPVIRVESAELARIELAAGEVVAFSRVVVARPVFYWVISIVIVVTGTASIVAAVVSEGRVGFVVVIPALLIVLLLLAAGWRVTAGPAGFTVRGIFGLPIFWVASGNIADASAVELDPIADFGGWGIRWALTPAGKSRTGIVVRAGEAVQVTRRDGRQLVVTVDDAATAAAVLRAYGEVGSA